ncbi:hypothetical protein BH20ACT5_BH20ACT5_13130 [soil metagenome]
MIQAIRGAARELFRTLARSQQPQPQHGAPPAPGSVRNVERPDLIAEHLVRHAKLAGRDAAVTGAVWY